MLVPYSKRRRPTGRETTVATFVLIHGGGDVGWYWHLVERELRQRGHDTLTPDLPCDDDSAGLAEYADVVVEAIGGRRGLVLAAQSFGGFTAPLVAARVPVDALVLVAGMIPAPGEAPDSWAANTGFDEVMREQAHRYSGEAREEPVGDSELRQRHAYRGGQHKHDRAARPGQGAGRGASTQIRRKSPGQPDGAKEDAFERRPPRVICGGDDGPRRRSAHTDQRSVQSAKTVPGSRNQQA
jgi:Alpha/beta hydrolase family